MPSLHKVVTSSRNKVTDELQILHASKINYKINMNIMTAISSSDLRVLMIPACLMPNVCITTFVNISMVPTKLQH
jgi:hypothetical protein